MFPFNEVSRGAKHKEHKIIGGIGRIFAIGTILSISDNIPKNTVIFKKNRIHGFEKFVENFCDFCKILKNHEKY